MFHSRKALVKWPRGRKKPARDRANRLKELKSEKISRRRGRHWKKTDDMKVVILCGGKGTRLREETEFRPKPMVPVGTQPILWHIMKSYAHYGHKEFILCLGYKGEAI